MKAIDSRKAKALGPGDAVTMAYGAGPVLVVGVLAVEKIDDRWVEIATEGDRNWVVGGEDRVLVIV